MMRTPLLIGFLCALLVATAPPALSRQSSAASQEGIDKILQDVIEEQIRNARK